MTDLIEASPRTRRSRRRVSRPRVLARHRPDRRLRARARRARDLLLVDVTTWRGKRVLVTGAGGFIGSHLVEALVAAGADVRAFVHYNSRNDWGNLEHLPARRPRRASRSSPATFRTRSASRARSPARDTVFHLAALIGIPYSYVAPATYVATNVTGTLNVLEAARDAGVAARRAHVDERDVRHRALHADRREPPAAGPVAVQRDQDRRRQARRELPPARSAFRSRRCGRSTPTARASRCAPSSRRSSAQALAGDDSPPRFAVAPCGDFTFVSDTVGAFIAVAEHETTIGQTLNAGSGKAISIGELAELIISTSTLRESPASWFANSSALATSLAGTSKCCRCGSALTTALETANAAIMPATSLVCIYKILRENTIRRGYAAQTATQFLQSKTQ